MSPKWLKPCQYGSIPVSNSRENSQPSLIDAVLHGMNNKISHKYTYRTQDSALRYSTSYIIQIPYFENCWIKSSCKVVEGQSDMFIFNKARYYLFKNLGNFLYRTKIFTKNFHSVVKPIEEALCQLSKTPLELRILKQFKIRKVGTGGYIQNRKIDRWLTRQESLGIFIVKLQH